MPVQTVAERGPEEAGVTPITFAELLRLPVDALILAGPDGTLCADTAAGVQARLVASAALVPTTPPRTTGAIIARATRLDLSRARRRARDDGGVFNIQSVVATWAERRAARLEAAFASPGPWRHARGLLPLWLYA
ncbi:MAG: hypothetical protein E6J14_13240 [Chloroflexi bacterium]|nr:MAG: hypothetical protein E6J14_13240 [Chloroflexota bacterium]